MPPGSAECGLTPSLTSLPGRGLVALVLGVGSLLVALPAASAAGSASGPVVLPGLPTSLNPLHGLHLRKDNLLRSIAPGAVQNDEQITAGVGSTGSLRRITEVQRLVVNGDGDYAVRERGPATRAVALGGSLPPLIVFGTVVWQGFSPGRRSLAARIVLEPAYESLRLPMRVTIRFTTADGIESALTPQLTAPTRGTVTVTVTDTATTNEVLQTGTGNAARVASALHLLQQAAGKVDGARLPTAGRGLPKQVGGHITGQLPTAVSAALRISGTLIGPDFSGPGVMTRNGHTSVFGTLDSGAVSFTAPMNAGQQLGLDLHVAPTIDPRVVAPPAPAKTWAQWAGSHPDASAVTAATQTLVTQAAAAAKADAYVPYLQADLAGDDQATFSYVSAPARIAVAALSKSVPLRPGSIALASLAALLILLGAAALRRSS